MISKKDLLKVVNMLYVILSKKLFWKVNFNVSFLLSGLSNSKKKRANFLLSRILFNRNRHLIKFYFENYLLLFFFAKIGQKKIITNNLFYVWNVFNFYIKNIPNIKQIKEYLTRRLIMKKNIFTCKYIFFHYLNNKILKNKAELIENIKLFLNNKNNFMFSINNLMKFINKKKIKMKYIYFILNKIKKSYLLNANSLFFLMFMKKRRYSFLPIFLWIYKAFDKISLNYWLVFLIFWLRSFIFFYLNIITYVFPPYKNIIRTSIYASRYFSNFSRNIIIEKKLCFNIYNKIINNFYILRSFSPILNYNYFQKPKFQHLREISFFQDIFSHWHLNINKFSKFINIHYNEYLYNYMPINFSSKDNLKHKANNYYLNNNKDIINTELFFNFEAYQKEKNMKNIIFSKMKNDNKINLYYHLKTKVPFLNKNLVHPSYIYISQADNVEINKETQIELKIEQKVRMAKKLKMTKKLKDLSFLNDLKLIINSEKLWKMLDARRKERKIMQKIKKYWKKKKKIKFFGYDSLKKNKVNFSKQTNINDIFLSLPANESAIETSNEDYNVIIPPINYEEKVQLVESKKKKKKKSKSLRREKISLKFLNKLLKSDKDLKLMKIKDNANLQKGLISSDKSLTPGQILASYVEKFTKIKFEMLNARDKKRNEKRHLNKSGKNRFAKNKFNKFNKFGKYFKNKRFNKFYKFNRFRKYNFFKRNRFKSFIKRTRIPINSKLYRYIKYLIFSRENKIFKNNIIDKYKIFRALDDKYKITKYGKVDRFNSFYKIISLHRYYNRNVRLKKDRRFSKKIKFRNKYANTLNLKFCHAWNAILQQYSKKILLPTRFVTGKPFWSFRLFDAITMDSYKSDRSEAKVLNSKVNFIKNDYFLDKFFSSFLNNRFLSSHYYSFFLYNVSCWHTMENYKSFYSFFSTKVELMSEPMQLLIFKNFVLSRFFNFFWKSFYFFNLSIFFKKNMDKLNSKVYFWSILHFLKANKYNYFNYILLNMNVRLLKYSRLNKEKFFRKHRLTKNKSFISKINRFILEINDLFFVKCKELLFVRGKFFRRKRKNILLILKILQLFSLKIFKGLALIKLAKHNVQVIYLYNFIKFLFKKLQNKFKFLKNKFFFSFLLQQKKEKKNLKTNAVKWHFKLKIYKYLIKFFKYSLFFSIFRLLLNKWEFILDSDIALDSLFFMEDLRKQALFLETKKSKLLFKKSLNYNLNFFIDFFFLQKKKSLLSDYKNLKHVSFATLLTFYKHYMEKDLAILKFIKKWKKKNKMINLLYDLPLYILEKKKRKGESQIKLNIASDKRLFLIIKRFFRLTKKLSFKLKKSAVSVDQNKSKLRKKILTFTLKKENYYYYKKMFRWRCFINIDSYKFLGLRFFNSLKKKYISTDSKAALKRRSFSRKKFNHKFLMTMENPSLKKGRNLFSLYNFFFKNFRSNGFMMNLNARKHVNEWPRRFYYWNFFLNKKINVNLINKGKLFSLKNKPLFFKLNKILPKVIVKNNFSIFYKEGANNLKKKQFLADLYLRRFRLNKNMRYWFNYLKKQEFNFMRKKKKPYIDKLQKIIAKKGSSAIFLHAFYNGHYLNFHEKFFFAPLQFHALKLQI